MPVTIEPRGDLALVVIDNPPVNATSKAVRAGLIEAARQVDADAAVRGAILICRGRTFVAGGDVSEFDGEPQPPHLPDVVARIEGADKPWLAAMHGSASSGFDTRQASTRREAPSMMTVRYMKPLAMGTEQMSLAHT